MKTYENLVLGMKKDFGLVTLKRLSLVKSITLEHLLLKRLSMSDSMTLSLIRNYES